MSLDAGDGYRFVGKAGIGSLLPSLGRFLPLAQQACCCAMAGQFAMQACSFLDALVLGLPIHTRLGSELLEHDTGILCGIHDLASRVLRETVANGIRLPEHDWECRVIIYLLDGELPLLRLVSEKRNVYRKPFETLPDIEPYFAWDGSDGPDDVPPGEWDHRLALWRRIGSPGSLSTGAPLVMTAVETNGVFPAIENVVLAQPSLECRASDCAKGFLLNEYIASNGVRIFDDPEKQADERLRIVMRDLMAFGEWVGTSAGKARLADVAAEFHGRLSFRYSAEEITARPSDFASRGPGPRR